jgi:Rab-GTPase-TBC domain
MLIESILPIDYYSNMVGVLIDQKILYEFFSLKMPDLSNHLKEAGFDPSLLGFQWMVCFLSYNLDSQISDKIWDLFFLKGP